MAAASHSATLSLLRAIVCFQTLNIEASSLRQPLGISNDSPPLLALEGLQTFPVSLAPYRQEPTAGEGQYGTCISCTLSSAGDMRGQMCK